MISQLQRIGEIHKRRPEHASLGVLRSPDIPSVLVETGFISNNSEERLLASDDYQQQLAEAIYKGLRNYFLAHPICAAGCNGTKGQYGDDARSHAAKLRTIDANSGLTATTGEPDCRR